MFGRKKSMHLNFGNDASNSQIDDCLQQGSVQQNEP